MGARQCKIVVGHENVSASEMDLVGPELALHDKKLVRETTLARDFESWD
jgi:hypothetical protein